MEFQGFPKIPRLSRNCVITEKIDGTSGCIYIDDDGQMEPLFLVGSRTRWITPGKETDNYGFARWAYDNKSELLKLGPGQHFGEWWGSGIQRGYGLTEKRFSLFNTHRWSDPQTRPACVGVVPVLYHGLFHQEPIDFALAKLRVGGSVAAPKFTGEAEGIVIYHEASKTLFKKTLEKDEEPKGVR